MRYLSEKATVGVTSLSRSTIRRMIEAGTFPAPIRIGQRRIAFDQNKVEDFLKSRPAA